jgi:hypothetical protein
MVHQEVTFQMEEVEVVLVSSGEGFYGVEGSLEIADLFGGAEVEIVELVDVVDEADVVGEQSEGLAVVAREVAGYGEVFVWGGFGFFVNERFEVADGVLT